MCQETRFPSGSVVKNLPAMQKTWVRSLGWEDPLEEDMETYSTVLAGRIPMGRGAWRATVHRVSKELDMHACMHLLRNVPKKKYSLIK